MDVQDDRGEKRKVVFSLRRKTKIGEGEEEGGEGRALLPVWRGPIERRR